jgi:hypothetical protein
MEKSNDEILPIGRSHSAYSKENETYLWAKLQLEISSFDFFRKYLVIGLQPMDKISFQKLLITWGYFPR